jgi:hypothetical protein
MARKRQSELDRDKLRAKAFHLLREGKTQSEVARSCGITVRTLQRWVNEAQEKVEQQGDLVAVVTETLSSESNGVVERLLVKNFFRNWMLSCPPAFRSWKILSKILTLATKTKFVRASFWGIGLV